MKDTATKERFSEFLIAERKRLKLSQSELGRRANIPAAEINRYEHQHKFPEYERFIHINEALGRSPGRTFMKVFYGHK